VDLCHLSHSAIPSIDPFEWISFGKHEHWEIVFRRDARHRGGDDHRYLEQLGDGNALRTQSDTRHDKSRAELLSSLADELVVCLLIVLTRKVLECLYNWKRKKEEGKREL